MEGYINIFVNNSDKEINLESFLSEVDVISRNFKKEYFCTWVYTQINFENEEVQTKLINYIKNENQSWNLFSYVVQKDLSRLSNLNVDGLEIREATKEDYSNVLECIIQAYLNGTSPKMYENIGIARFKDNIKEYYKDLISERNIVLIGEYNGQFCGHVSLNIDVTDDINGNSQAKLIDTYVLTEFHGLNISTALTIAAERKCMQLGIQQIEGTVDEDMNNPNKSNPILKGLKKMNWKIDSIIFLN